ncbi:Nif3-like dinuclear metal center hexameric protein [Alicyclobacillus sp. SO9]|uniref:Nif3-like dinuclear metal center hexameric protein n=1 Tax=Alicyclobacillus sp. SO9 TaxID=2665646 RepID=UPI0018E89F7B|nr:Nif3-like dinuclear metal center hexameric protein [Alicyclobacillus sp. SO9]QQE77907.1 Nif3-like dinuclear metal center hexameric protein [Alicyclobacillus sp. SO9]
MPTVGEVIRKVTGWLGPVESRVDTLKSGSTEAEVKGIVTTFMPSYSVLLQTAQLGSNLVIAHEAPFYHHMDKVEMLEDDIVFRRKQNLIEKKEMSIFRLHDHMHRNNPDGIVQGLIQDLDWSKYIVQPSIEGLLPLNTPPLSIPAISLKAVAEYVKRKLDVSYVKVVGNLSMQCSRVGVLPGYTGGGELAIPFLRRENLDLVIIGEGPEWETPEYVRDAIAVGMHKALIIIGHLRSEESGMKYLAESVKSMFPLLPVQFIAEDPPFQLV